MRMLNFNKQQFVFGLDYIKLPVCDNENIAINYRNQAADRIGSQHGWCVKQGLAFLGKGIKPHRHLYSAAHAAAQTWKNAIIFLPLDLSSDQWWLCLIVNGEVTSHRDLIGYRSQLNKSFKDSCTLAKRLYQLNQEKFLFIVDDSIETRQSVFDVSQVNMKKFMSQVSAHAKPVSRIAYQFRNKIIKTTLAAISISVMSSLVYASNVADDASQQFETFQQEQRSVKVEAVKNKLINLYNNTIAETDVLTWVAEIYRQVKTLSLQDQGWQINEIQCVSSQNYCNVSWKNEGDGSNQYFNQRYPDYTKTYSLDGHYAKFKLPLRKLSTPRFTKFDIEKLPVNAHFFVDAISDLQKVRSTELIDWSIHSATPVKLSKPDRQLVFDENMENLLFQSGRWDLRGEDFWSLPLAVKRLDSQYFSAKKLHIKFLPGSDKTLWQTKWKIGGHYVKR
jgi:hypothetical protein